MVVNGGENMDSSSKAIANRINKELKKKDMKQSDLLKEIIKFKKPDISKKDMFLTENKKKGNFSTALKGNTRSITKEDLYIIAKVLGVSLEYLWFGEEIKPGFIPMGARYTAYQDSDDAYRTFIANLEYEDKIQYGDEFGKNLFRYMGEFESINGYRFFVKNFDLFFDYVQYNQLMYINSEKQEQFCDNDHQYDMLSDNLISTLIKHNDVKTFKTIYFDNCALARFSPENYRRDRKYFSNYFLESLLSNESFFELIFKSLTT